MLMSRNKRIRQISGAVESFNLLSLKLLLKNPSRYSRFPGVVFREYMSHVRQGRWASKELFEIFPAFNNLRVTLEHKSGRGIINPIDELAYMAIITKGMAPTAVFEIGTFRGRTALNFALNSPERCKVYTLDLPPDSPLIETNKSDTTLIHKSDPGADYRGSDVEYKIKQLYGNSMEFDFSPYHDKVDIVFVDGAHHYEAVASDTENALKMVKPGGVILWHDFANYGDYHDVTRAVLDIVGAYKIAQIGRTQLAVHIAPDD